MSKIPTILEQQLADLRPVGLDEAFLDRLTRCIEGEGELLSGEENLAESQLVKRSPSSVPVALHERLLESIGDTPFSVDGTILLFNKAKAGKSAEGSVQRRSFMKFNIAAAAAVALLGSVTALIYPGASSGGIQSVVDRDPVIERAPVTQAAVPANYAPASYSRDLSSMKDEGVFFQNGRLPYRSYHMFFMDKGTMKNKDGEMIEYEEPRTERLLIPEKID